MVTTPILTTRSVEWSPVIAGSLVAGAISLVLIQFGNGIGLSYSDLSTDQAVTLGNIISIGLWVIWVQLIASVSGGYLAGRMTTRVGGETESELRDGAHGLLVWALCSVVTLLLVGAAAALAALAVQQGVAPEPAMSEDMAQKAGIITGFGVATSSLIAAVAAWASAVLGGDHRDRNPDVKRYVSFRRA